MLAGYIGHFSTTLKPETEKIVRRLNFLAQAPITNTDTLWWPSMTALSAAWPFPK